MIVNSNEADKVLPMTTELYNGFGGWQITKNRESYFTEEPNMEFDECKTLAQIELEVKSDPDHDWKAVLDLPLRSAVYQRRGEDEWVLIETGMGFA